jgi:hypothetical protein
MRSAYKILVGSLKGRKPLARPRHRWEDIVKMYSREIGFVVQIGFIWLKTGTVGRLL